MALLSWRDVGKAYAGRPAVDGVTLDVEPGEVLGLLGPSGSGKSTLLRLTAGLEAPDRGAVFSNGQDLSGVPPHARGFGLMFQDYCLFPHMSVRANVEFGLRMKGWPRARRESRAREMLRLVRMEEFASRGVAALSGGEQQRVALARSLAPSPALLMLDEPLGALDALLRGELLEELRRILGVVGATALYVTHDRAEAMALCSRIAVMNAGRVEQVGTGTSLVSVPRNRFVASFLGLGLLVDAAPRRVPDGWTAQTNLGEIPATLAEAARMDEPARLNEAAAWSLLIRPSAVRFTQAPGFVRTAARVDGFVTSGTGTTVRLTLGSGEKARVLECALPAEMTPESVGSAGDVRGIWLDRRGCLLVAEERRG
jgi:ABC-type Fe3+/spermidine/putrescine transport system ATPase subunit